MKIHQSVFDDKQKSKTHLKKIRLIILSAVIGLCYLGCGGSGGYYDQAKNAEPMTEETKAAEDNFYGEENETDSASESPSSGAATGAIPNPSSVSQKLIKTGNANLEVKDVKKAYEEIKAMSEKYDGYIFEMNEYSGYDHKTIDLTVKVDYRKFETMMAELEQTGNVLSSSMSTQDVTREYIDVKARVDTLKIQETTLKQLLSKASDVKDLLEIETELQRVREQIEAAQGRLNYLNDAVSYSTIHISLTTKILPTQTVKKEGIGERLAFEFQDGLGYWGGVLIDFIGGVLWLLPFLIVVFALLFALREKLKALLIAIFSSPKKNLPPSAPSGAKKNQIQQLKKEDSSQSKEK
ncbi:MAG: DUF4349 domain-containing protein [Peptostreptococcaceae bacterium]|nr:DUF4349 domain-containing protein [Peptostreptococcaceae bacterium]